MDKSTGSRAAYFTNEQQTIILEKYEEVKHIILAKSNTAAAAKCRMEQLAKNRWLCESQIVYKYFYNTSLYIESMVWMCKLTGV